MQTDHKIDIIHSALPGKILFIPKHSRRNMKPMFTHSWQKMLFSHTCKGRAQQNKAITTLDQASFLLQENCGKNDKNISCQKFESDHKTLCYLCCNILYKMQWNQHWNIYECFFGNDTLLDRNKLWQNSPAKDLCSSRSGWMHKTNAQIL